MKMYYTISVERGGVVVPFVHVRSVERRINGTVEVRVGSGDNAVMLFDTRDGDKFIEQYTKWLDAQGKMFDATNTLTNIAIVSARANIAVAEKALGGTDDSTNS